MKRMKLKTYRDLGITICGMITVCSTFFASCDLYMSHNGALDGFWQLKTIEKLNGCTQEMYPLPMYWSFEADLMQVCNQKDYSIGIFFRFDKSNGNLRLYSPAKNKRSEGDIVITDASKLYGYGIFHLNETFAIETLNSENMVLRSDSIRAIFRKY